MDLLLISPCLERLVNVVYWYIFASISGTAYLQMRATNYSNVKIKKDCVQNMGVSLDVYGSWSTYIPYNKYVNMCTCWLFQTYSCDTSNHKDTAELSILLYKFNFAECFFKNWAYWKSVHLLSIFLLNY